MAEESKPVRILNRSHTAITLTEPMPNPEKPGDAPPLRTISLAAHGTPGSSRVSEVDGEVWSAWKQANPNHAFLANGILEEVGDDYKDPDTVFGHEPMLEAAAKDPEAVRLAEAGVPMDEDAEAGSLTAADMTPVNSTPPGDDAGEPRHASQPGEPEPERSPGRRPSKGK